MVDDRLIVAAKKRPLGLLSFSNIEMEDSTCMTITLLVR